MGEKHKPVISVIVPIYNTEKYLETCIESILGQTFQDLEILLVNDGSTDGSGQICDRYAAEDGRITVVHQKQSGLVAARKKGVACSCGDYIAFVDSDDWIDLDMFESMMDEVQNAGIPIDIVAGGVKREFPGYVDWKLNHLPAGVYDESALLAMYSRIFFDKYFEEWEILPYLCGKLFSRALHLYSGLMEIDNEITRGEDCLGVFQAILKAKSLLVCKEAFYHYRQANYIGSEPVGVQISDLQIRKLLQGFHKTVNRHAARERLSGQVQLISWNYLLQARHEEVQAAFLDFLVPYPEVPRGARIVLYGAGVYGRSIYQSLQKTPVCQVIGWVDQRWDSTEKTHMGVEPVESLLEKDFDYVVISILNERISEEIVGTLCGLGIERSKIAYIRADVLRSLALPKKFSRDWDGF